MSELWLGLITGIFFGGLLQQGRVLRFEKQVGAMLLKDMTIMKFMMSAILVGMVGVHLAVGMGMAQLNPKATQIGANIVGGICLDSAGRSWVSVPAPPSAPSPKAVGMRSSRSSG